jgi:hypothetical protein
VDFVVSFMLLLFYLWYPLDRADWVPKLTECGGEMNSFPSLESNLSYPAASSNFTD